jgi:hypothetical protein
VLEKKLDFSPLEVRGIYFQQQLVLQAAQQFDQAKATLDGYETAAASILAGRLPDGVTIRGLRIDQTTDSVFAPVPPPTETPAP